MERRKLKASGKVQLASLDQLDGRTTAVRSATRLRAAIADDLGGIDALSAAQQTLLNTICTMHAMLEDAAARYLAGEKIDQTQFATLANSVRRLLADLGLERKARDVTPSLRDYVKGRAA